MSKKTLLVALAGMAGIAIGADAQADDASYTVTGNVALTSDYVFRGLTQTWNRPAIQGGADLSMKNGFAAGLWGSSVSDKTYPGGSMELDLYASYGRAIDDDWSWRAGIYSYLYPGADLDEAGLPSRSFNTVEANFALTWKQWTLKWNRALTDYFGVDREQGYRGDSKGTTYWQLEGAYPLGPRWTLTLRAGYTDYRTELVTPTSTGGRDPSYADFGLGAKYQIDQRWAVVAVATHATNSRFYRRTASFDNPNDTRDVGGTRGFVQLQGTF